MFAVQHGGWCAASNAADNTFDKYGKSSACGKDGEGGSSANNVYLLSKSAHPFIHSIQTYIFVSLEFNPFFPFMQLNSE